jgi:hypothetical protein
MMQKPNNNLFIAVTSAPYTLEKSTNLGLNWSSLFTFAGANRGICYDINGNIYTSGNGGVWKSTNEGATFMNHGLTYSANQITSVGNKIMAALTGTTNGGIWIYTDTTLTGVGNENQLTKEFSLSQNYPNPFNPKTRIRFVIGASTSLSIRTGNRNVKLTIYNIVGQEKEILLKGEIKEGEYEVEWNAINFPSGVYYYALNVNGIIIDTKKMVLLK